MIGYLIIAIFIGSWLLSMLIYRLKGYDRIEVTRRRRARAKLIRQGFGSRSA